MARREWARVVVIGAIFLVGCDSEKQPKGDVGIYTCPYGYICAFDSQGRKIILDPKTGEPMQFIEDQPH